MCLKLVGESNWTWVQSVSEPTLVIILLANELDFLSFLTLLIALIDFSAATVVDSFSRWPFYGGFLGSFAPKIELQKLTHHCRTSVHNKIRSFRL